MKKGHPKAPEKIRFWIILQPQEPGNANNWHISKYGVAIIHTQCQ